MNALILIPSGDVGLREARLRKLLSQRELARRADVSLATITNIETGKIRPHPSTLRKLAEALDVDPEELAEHLERRSSES
jgi:transcriptional regulator with XRE-family HTH domain